MLLTFLIDLIRKLRIPILVLLVVGLGMYVRGCWRADSTQSDIADLVSAAKFDSAWSLKRSAGTNLDECQRQQATLFLAKHDTRSDTAIFRALDTLKKSCWYPADSTMEFAALGHLRIAAHARLDTNDRWKVYASAFRMASECVKADSAQQSCWYLGFDALEGMRDTFSTRSWARMARTRWPEDASIATLEGMALVLDGKLDSAKPFLAKSCPDSALGLDALAACRKSMRLNRP
ncbi:MAG: hypothetical protein IPK50_17385 [Fibrobacterota bacterium]|nr:hypothetical protein [Fibrobacterota bacterium]QQS04049.1 MAG: hypothetical protein IPK50_17385 [Fibrobacterota bacterium]